MSFAPDGRPMGALHGYLDMVSRLLASRRPDEVVHAYDHDWRPMARTQIFAGYKAGRPPEPDDLTPQFALLREVLDFTGMTQVQAPDWEAEDAIGAFCAKAGDGDTLEIVSGDRDLLQLVRDTPPSIKVLYTLRGVSELHEFDEAAVLEKYGVPASRYAEFAILRGDPSDGLPGVQGVGEKTALALVQAYPDIDAMLADAASESPQAGPMKGKPALRSRLLASADYLDAMRASGADQRSMPRWRSGTVTGGTMRCMRSPKSTACEGRCSGYSPHWTASPDRRAGARKTLEAAGAVVVRTPTLLLASGGVRQAGAQAQLGLGLFAGLLVLGDLDDGVLRGLIQSPGTDRDRVRASMVRGAVRTPASAWSDRGTRPAGSRADRPLRATLDPRP